MINYDYLFFQVYYHTRRTHLELSRFVFVQTKLYIEDWIGLRSLDEAGRVKFIKVAGGHLGISNSDMKKYIVPYLVDLQKKHVSWS